MFSRNYFYWLSSLSYPRLTLVPQSLLVFLTHIELLFLWRESLRLLWCSIQSRWNFAISHHLSSLPVILLVLHWIRMVCFVAGQKVLHEAVQLVCMDTCCFIDCCHTKLFDYPEHIRRLLLKLSNWKLEYNFSYFFRNDLVHRSRDDDCL